MKVHMTTQPTQKDGRNSNAYARQRDERIAWVLERHPTTARMLVEIGLFTSAARARKRLRRLVTKGKLRLAGTVSLRDGRPEHLYCCGQWLKADNLLHEAQLTCVCFKTHADEIRRGSDEVDPFIRPDAEFFICGQRYFLELDRGTISYPTIMRTHFARYSMCTDTVLWVCPTVARMEGLRRRARTFQADMLFTTFDLAVRNPHAMIWINVEGTKITLPRGEKEVQKRGIKPSS
jgi:hypothetical protein